jgi:DNA repair protein RecO (recombination protein O)
MSIVKTEAFILKGFRYGESSKIITFYSKDYGKLSGIVKATRTMKSKFGGAAESINYVRIIFNKKENRELQFITGAECIDPFSKIKADLDKLNAAFRILELLNHAVHDYDTNLQLFELLHETLLMLNTAEANFENYLLYFQVKLVKLLGINPINTEILGETLITNAAFNLDKKQSAILSSVERNGISFVRNLVIEGSERRRLIDIYDFYMSTHLENFGFLKTKKIITDINS